MKGRNKDFNRYLDYELNDCYLEAPEKSKQKLFQEDKTIKYKQFNHDDTSLSKNKPDDPSTFRYHIESPMFHDFSINNGSDLGRIHDFMVSPQRKQSYRHFESPSMSFMCLTTNLEKEVSLWKYSYLTSAVHNFEVPRTVIIGTFDLVTQLRFARKEKTVETRFIDDKLFYIVSTEDESLFNVRFYDVKILTNAINTAKGVSKSHSIPPIGLYSFKLVISNYKTPSDDQNFIHVALWKNEVLNNLGPNHGPITGTENTVKVAEKTYKAAHRPFSHNTSDLPYILKGSNGVTILIDSANSYYIAWNEESIITSNYHTGALKSIRQVDNTIFMRNKSGVEYELSLEKFPQVQLKQMSPSDEIISVLEMIDENNVKHQNIKNIIKRNGIRQLGLSFTFQYDIYGKPPTGDSTADNELIKNGEEKEKKENVFARIQKTKKDHKRTKSGDDMFQINNDMLKELRSDIRSKIKEARKFDAEYKQGEKIERSEDFGEPEGVTKELLGLYKEIKTEKKKMRKDMEKKKDHRKNGKFDE